MVARFVLEHRVYVSTQVLQEVFHTLTRRSKERLSVEAGLAYRDDLSRWDPVHRPSALTREVSISFWDALIVAAAARSGAKTLYTEDLSDGQEILGVRVVNPFREAA